MKKYIIIWLIIFYIFVLFSGISCSEEALTSQEDMPYEEEVGSEISISPTDDSDPSWSPDGKKIAFNSYRDGNGEVYIMNVDGSGQINLTDNPADDKNPSWSPDGRKITFQSNRDGGFKIYVINIDGQK